MYGVTLYAEAAARQLLSGNQELATRHLSEIRETAQESLCEMRLLVFELRLPLLKQEGLASALRARLEAVESRVGLETQFEAKVEGRLSPEIEEGLYRIAQEALNNALRHAQAQSVTVELRQNGEFLRLTVIDDGAGFDPAAAREQGGFGLRSMEERAARLGGALRVDSSPGQGSRVSVEVRQ
jgi:signal transduction histidine kinase